jgi:hypothetical protein
MKIEVVKTGGPQNTLKAVSCVPYSHPQDQEPAIYVFTFDDGSVWELNTYAQTWQKLWGKNGLFQSKYWKSEIVPEDDPNEK